jgi:hypothetical protein
LYNTFLTKQHNNDRNKVRILSATGLSDPTKRGKPHADAYVVVKGRKVDEDNEEVVHERAELGRTIAVRGTNHPVWHDKAIILSEEHTSRKLDRAGKVSKLSF